MDDITVNPWPAIRELQDIVRELNGEIRELKERMQKIEDLDPVIKALTELEN